MSAAAAAGAFTARPLNQKFTRTPATTALAMFLQEHALRQEALGCVSAALEAVYAWYNAAVSLTQQQSQASEEAAAAAAEEGGSAAEQAGTGRAEDTWLFHESIFPRP